MIKIICPKDKTHEKFHVTAHVTQRWEVDSHNNFINVVSNCDEVTHKPNFYDVYNCSVCGAEAEIEEC